MGIWDVDKFEEEIPVCMIMEWNNYLNWELAQMTKGILGAIPVAKRIESGGSIKLTKPDDICNFFDALNKDNDNG
ncbi:MAG: hypothetical protein SNJ71_00825 [Bacteroidales bacterium]